MASGFAFHAARTAGIAVLACFSVAGPAFAGDPPTIAAIVSANPDTTDAPLKVVIPNLRVTKQLSKPKSDIVLGAAASRQPASGDAAPTLVKGSAPSSLFEQFYSELFPGHALPSLPEILRAALPADAAAPKVAILAPPAKPKPVKIARRHRHLRHYAAVKHRHAESHFAAAKPQHKHFADHSLNALAVAMAAPPARKHFRNPPVEPLPWLVAEADPAPAVKAAAPVVETGAAPLPWLSPLFAHHTDTAAAEKPAPAKQAKPDFAEKAPTAPLAKDPLNREHLPETAVAAGPGWLSNLFASDETPAAPAAPAAKPVNIIYASANNTAAAEVKPAVIKTYHSPGIIIHKETVHMTSLQPEVAEAKPEQLAALVPAAGDTAPLIPLPPPPAQPSNAPSPALPPPPLPPAMPPVHSPSPLLPLPPAAAIPPAPLPPAPMPPAINNSAAPAPQTPPMPPVAGSQAKPAPLSLPDSSKTCLPGDKNCAGNANDNDNALRSIVGKSAPAKALLPADEPPVTLPSIPTGNNASKATSKAPVKSSPASASHHHHKTHKEKTAAKPKAKLPHIPASLGHKTKTAAPFSVEHAREMKDVFKPEGDEGNSIKRQGMDIQVEVKKPTMNSDYELQRAYDAVTAGNSTAAMDIYKDVLKSDPDNTNALFGLATLYHRAGDATSARRLYTRLLSIDPGNRDGWNNYLALTAEDDPKDAIAHLEALEAKNPAFSPIPAQLAIIYQKLGDQDKAISNMTDAVKLAPDNLTYRYDLAIMFDRQGKYDQAAALYRQIVEAYQRGDKIPGSLDKIQQRLTFISSNSK